MIIAEITPPTTPRWRLAYQDASLTNVDDLIDAGDQLGMDNADRVIRTVCHQFEKIDRLVPTK
jgi:hypothetical protein